MDNRIRVLRIIARLNVGGPALHTTLLTKRLDPKRYETRLVTGREAPREDNHLELHGESVGNLIMIPELGREIQGWSDIRTLIKLIQVMKEFQPHIVHTHTAKAGALGRLAALLTGTPIVLHTYHGHIFHGYFSPMKARLFRLIERYLADFTDQLITVSPAVRDELLSLGVGRSEQFRVIPLGLDLTPFRKAAALRGELRSELQLTSEDLLVGMVARLVPIKRHHLLLEVASRIVNTIPTCHFLLVGDGELRKELEVQTHRLQINDRVHFLGWRTDLARIYADLDLVVLTSANEGLPVSLIEAMAAAKPVVATNVGGVSDLVQDGETGYLVPSNDTNAFTKALSSLLSDAQGCQLFGLAGQKKVYPSFSADRLVADIDCLYTDLIKEKFGTFSN